MNYAFHAAAEQDIADAQDFYAQHAGFQVATRFLDELQHVIGHLRILIVRHQSRKPDFVSNRH